MIRTVLCIGLLAILTATKPVSAAESAHSHFFKSDALIDFDDKERWIIRVRALLYEPDDSANISSIGGSADVDEQYAPELDVTYFLNEKFGLELSLAAPPFDVTATDTAVGQLDLGNVWALTPTLMMQYHFALENKRFRPYVGAGISYTHFFNEEGAGVDRVDYEDSLGYALQAGFDYGITEHWSLNLEVKKMFIDTKVSIDRAAVRNEADVDIDPWVFGIGVAYRF